MLSPYIHQHVFTYNKARRRESSWVGVYLSVGVLRFFFLSFGGLLVVLFSVCVFFLSFSCLGAAERVLACLASVSALQQYVSSWFALTGRQKKGFEVPVRWRSRHATPKRLCWTHTRGLESPQPQQLVSDYYQTDSPTNHTSRAILAVCCPWCLSNGVGACDRTARWTPFGRLRRRRRSRGSARRRRG